MQIPHEFIFFHFRIDNEAGQVKKRLIILLSLIGSILLFPFYLNAALGDFHFKIIRLAFMNGYVRALEMDQNVIMKVKKNKDIMKKIALYQADEYMKEVISLNKQLHRVAADKRGAMNAVSKTRAYQRALW